MQATVVHGGVARKSGQLGVPSFDCMQIRVADSQSRAPGSAHHQAAVTRSESVESTDRGNYIEINDILMMGSLCGEARRQPLICSYSDWVPSTMLCVSHMPRRPLLRYFWTSASRVLLLVSWLLMFIKSLSTSTCTRFGRPRFQGIHLLAFALEKLFATLRGALLGTSLFVCCGC